MNKNGDGRQRADHLYSRQQIESSELETWLVHHGTQSEQADSNAAKNIRIISLQMERELASKLVKDAVDELYARIEQRQLGDRYRIEIAPGYSLHRLLGSICPPAFRERELDALHADAVALYLEKLVEGDKWGALRVKWAMRGWLLWTVFGGAVNAVVSLIMGKHKPSK